MKEKFRLRRSEGLKSMRRGNKIRFRDAPGEKAREKRKRIMQPGVKRRAEEKEMVLAVTG